MDEIDKIKERYKSRQTAEIKSKYAQGNTYSKNIVKERELLYASVLTNKFAKIEDIKLLEIGAGEGLNLNGFMSLGIPKENITINELLEDRVVVLKQNYPDIKAYSGNALDIPSSEQFDVVFQSTVFTSILDKALKQHIANKMLELVKPNGIILWYDFVYDNPNNKDVKGVSKQEIRQLFAKASKITIKKVTLAPPIGRRVGNLYGILNGLFPFLRSHVVAVIEK